MSDPVMSILQILTSAGFVYDRTRSKAAPEQFAKINTGINAQIPIAGETIGVLSGPSDGTGTRVVSGGFFQLSGGASRLFQIFVKDERGTVYPISSSSTSPKNLIGELYLRGKDVLIVVVAGAADTTALIGHLSYYDLP